MPLLNPPPLVLSSDIPIFQPVYSIQVKKLPLILTIAATLIVATLAILYFTRWSNKPVTPWELVPGTAIAVFEPSECQECYLSLRNSPLAALIAQNIVPFDSILSPKEFPVLPGNLTSIHSTRDQQLEIIIYHPNAAQVLPLLEAKKSKSGWAYASHTYNNIVLHELKTKTQLLTWASIDQVLVLSTSPVLMEDVVRTFNREQPAFKNELAKVFSLPRIARDAGNLFVSLRAMPRLLQTIAQSPANGIYFNLGSASLLDIRTTDNSVVLNGFSADSVSNGSLLSFFRNQAPVSLSIMRSVSNQTASLVHFGISSGSELRRHLPTHQKDSVVQIMQDYKLTPSALLDNFQGELAYLQLEPRGGKSDPLVLMRTSNQAEWMQTMALLAEKLSTDTIHHETFGTWEIRQVPVRNFLASTFSPLLPGTDLPFYASDGSHLIFARTTEELRHYLEDIENEETWGKSLTTTRFLESTLSESSVSFFFNPMGDPAQLKAGWRQALTRKPGNAIGLLALQFSFLNNTFYTNLAIQSGRAASTTQPTGAEWTTNFSQTLTGLWLVKNHQDKSQEILVQDTTNQISLVSANGKVLWTRNLPAPIRGEVHQIDFFNNGKLQMCFLAGQSIHLLDRNGDPVTPYPLSLREAPEFLTLIDYDRSRRYRLLVTGRSGKLWMYDKSGQLLEGWNPNKLAEKPAFPPQHFRITARDYLLAVSPLGKAYLFNRRGEAISGFPLDLQARPEGGVTWDDETKAFTIVSREGNRVSFTPNGERKAEPILKTSPDSRFALIPEMQSEGYRILRLDKERGTLFNEELQELATQDFFAGQDRRFSFRDAGSNNQFILVVDQSEELAMIYNGNGNPLRAVPFGAADLKIGDKSSGTFRIFYISGSILTSQPVE